MVLEAPALTGDVRVAPAMGMQKSSRGRKRGAFAYGTEEEKKTPGDIYESLGMGGCIWMSSMPSNSVMAINSRRINI
jgi:hypothetical protein